MNREKKFYAAPELEIEKFTIECANSISSGDSSGLEGSGTDFDNNGDWEF